MLPTVPSMSHVSLPRRSLLCGLIALAAMRSGIAQTQQRLVLTRIGHGARISGGEDALTQAYAALGYSVVFRDLPAERALIESDSGRMDGETARITGMDLEYPHLRRVDVVLLYNSNAAFVYGAKTALPDSLKQLSQLRSVGILGGRKVPEQATQGWGNVLRLNSYESAIRMLVMGRIDAFLGRDEDMHYALEREGFNIRDFPSREMVRAPLFHYLHQKHQSLIPALTQELLRIKGKHESVIDAFKAKP